MSKKKPKKQKQIINMLELCKNQYRNYINEKDIKL